MRIWNNTKNKLLLIVGNRNNEEPDMIVGLERAEFFEVNPKFHNVICINNKKDL